VGALGKHYKIPEIAKLWQYSPETVRQLFKNHPSVLKINRPEWLHKRGYVSLRVPESVLHKLYADLRNGK
jgi:hypothetical protein